MTRPAQRWMGIGMTDVGRVRKNNQDAFLVSNSLGLFIVADGMGGHAGGDVASRLAIEAFQNAIGPIEADPSDTTRRDIHTEDFLRRMVTAANDRILEEARRSPELRNMGTTLVVAGIVDAGDGPLVRVIHVGDSRAYLYRRGVLRQLTHDHSVVEDFVRRGLMSQEEASVHPKRHALTRAVGIDQTVEPDYISEPLQSGDLLLLCTDGLTKMIQDRELEDWVGRLGARPDTLCRSLVDESNRRGGHDNVTLVICSEAS